MKTLLRRICILILLIMCVGEAVIYFSRAEAIDTTSPALSGVDCSASGMAMIELNSGRLIAQKSKDKRLPMASTTKIVTAITVIENCDNLDKVVTIPNEAVGVEGSSIYLQHNEQLKIIDLLYGLMLQSGNDCAVALAIIVGENVQNFANMMNELASKVGANNSHFVNPHGLHDDDHYTTAYDLAKISAYAMNNEIFRQIVGTKTYKTPWKNHEYGRIIVNKNKILSFFPGGNGIKTGYTKKAGRCLVSSAERDGKTIICVVLNCGPMFQECARLMNLAFDSLVMGDIIKVGVPIARVEVIDGEQKFVYVGLESVASYPLTAEEARRLTTKIELPEMVYAPISKGERIGKIHFYLNNQLIFSEDLFTIESVETQQRWEIVNE
ncbi:MAG: D-alanyl-D-alanine carboxypeptidase [Clostridia bacterium]|nr:D-alanyl-D-alanine carboxypeptidase [Clostridia bacterium]